MTELEIAQLIAENQALRQKLAAQETLNAQLLERIQSLEARLAQDSHNSSQPPSTDAFKRSPKKRSLRTATGKKPGGQRGHNGQTLRQLEPANVDHFVAHRPTHCEKCQTSLHAQPTLDHSERRQVFELPPPYRLHVTEHLSCRVVCPTCQHPTTGAFPTGVTSQVQYGPAFRAVAVYLVCYQLLPYKRACELLNELYCTSLSPGTLARLVQQTYHQLAASEKTITAALSQAPVLHCDETGLAVGGKRQWLHVASTPALTHYAYHPKRGKAATEAMGILGAYKGTAVHDGWASYASYECQHALCNAHHLRELTFVHEQLGQNWAAELKTLLLALKAEVETAKADGESELSPARLAHYESEYQRIIEAGLAANPPPPLGWLKSERGRGRPKQTKAKNLLDRLSHKRAEVLRFAYRFDVPFDNNQAERDIRMVKVQQKISGHFRSESGAKYWCRIRGYLATMKKQGQNLLVALFDSFRANPPLPAQLT